ncbi:hypothetical protein B5M42_008915 [Paenibacillus athensensis]|uniref:Butirosin biosynthesis protein H N-terminal domain-containing protein n=1 Tax=Paenibacillus athensensis TaxID=1967502 RepID=A0A4Y8QB76_9BACL|nr:hypothetical protein [Paenibacillus athensensis]MCD1258957.1 hypothetical protein [Paenibacillus athensensis]
MEPSQTARRHPYLHYEYYFDSQGRPDEFAKLLNCFQAPLYFLLKGRLGLRDPYPLFMQDPGFHLVRRADGGLSSIEPRQAWSSVPYFDIGIYRLKGAEGTAKLCELLDEGHFVMLQTHSQRVPFYQHFQSLDFPFDEPLHNSRQNHFFTILGYDEQSFYYMDAVREIRQHDFVPYRGFKHMGIVSKAALEPAFSSFMNLYTFEPRQAAVEATLLPQGTLDMLDQVRKRAREPAEERDGLVMENELQALDSLVAACENGELLLQGKPDRYDLNWCALMEWKFDNLRQRKYILLRCMEMSPLFQQSPYRELVQTWSDNTTLWLVFVSKLRKLLRTQQFPAPQETAAILSKLRASEYALIDNLDHFVSKIFNN